MWPPDALTSPLPRFLIVSVLAAVLHAAPAEAQLKADLVVSGLTQPVGFVQDPSDAAVHVVVQQDGRIRALRNGVLQTADFLDLRAVVLNSGEQGLLGLAFAPDYATSGRVFVNFSNLQGHTVIARFTRMAGDPLRADPATRFDLLWPGGQRLIPQPFANHNGGHMAFGPDGFLYIGMGDGGSGNDPYAARAEPGDRCSARCCASTSTFRRAIPRDTTFRRRTRLSAGPTSSRKSGAWACAIPGAGALTTSAAAAPARSSSATWARTPLKRSTTNRANRGGRNYGWPQREGAHNNVTRCTPFSRRDRSDLRIRPRGRPGR